MSLFKYLFEALDPFAAVSHKTSTLVNKHREELEARYTLEDAASTAHGGCSARTASYAK